MICLSAISCVVSAASSPTVKVLLATGRRTANQTDSVVLAIDAATGAVRVLSSTTPSLPGVGVGMAFDAASSTLYSEGFNDALGSNTFVTTAIGSGGGGSSSSVLRPDNVFDFELGRPPPGGGTAQLWGFSDTGGNLSIGSVNRASGNFTAVAEVEGDLNLMMGSTFDPSPTSGGGTFVLMSLAKDKHSLVLVSAELTPGVPTRLSPPVQGLQGSVFMWSLALLPSPGPSWGAQGAGT